MGDFSSQVGGVSVDWFAPNSSHWDNVWVSNEFRQLMHRPSWLRDEVMPFISARPLGWFDPPAGSRFYFSAWLINAVMRRTYANPLIQDLYVLHEALHAASLDSYFRHAKTPDDALRSNEIQVSLETECWVYLRHPEWIGKTFDDLWVMQPHIQQRLHCSAYNQAINTPQEQKLYALANNAGWPIGRLGCNTDSLWWVRRGMNRHALSPSDQTVRRYEKMADKWIAEISNKIMLVQSGRFALADDLSVLPWQQAVDNWMQYSNDFLHNGLPFGDLQLQSGRS